MAEKPPRDADYGRCEAKHRLGFFCTRQRGHGGYHQSYSSAIWINKYVRYGKLDANGLPLQDTHNDGDVAR